MTIDLTRYRCPACYVVALFFLRAKRNFTEGTKVLVNSKKDANWLRQRLERLGYVVTTKGAQNDLVALHIARPTG